MKKIYLFEHFVAEEVVEQLASFDKEALLDHAYKVERESPTEAPESDDPAVAIWQHEHPTYECSENDSTIYFSYDQYLEMEEGEMDCITIKEIDFLDWVTSPKEG